ncbi:MAG TPA: hypothetical protein VIL20_18105 [Sandaracinaceae bacterium]
MTRSRSCWTFVIAAASFALGFVLASRAPTEAQSSGPALPRSCSPGQIVVGDGFDRFRCVAVNEVLGLRGCRDGDLVRSSGGGQLECGRPSFCNTPALVGLDSFGRVECAPRLPDCPRGAQLVSEGNGRWTCASR